MSLQPPQPELQVVQRRLRKYGKKLDNIRKTKEKLQKGDDLKVQPEQKAMVGSLHDVEMIMEELEFLETQIKHEREHSEVTNSTDGHLSSVSTVLQPHESVVDAPDMETLRRLVYCLSVCVRADDVKMRLLAAGLKREETEQVMSVVSSVGSELAFRQSLARFADTTTLGSAFQLDHVAPQLPSPRPNMHSPGSMGDSGRGNEKGRKGKGRGGKG
eukprot:GEMP01086355.1.p1 GENE.GEMP01086355.1~~GEMP01086355.1.p1  ORF type:complete len:215 (+),score=49.58 GEMP01086355.1:102-746(+)